MHISEVNAKTVLTKTGIPGFTYCLNPYVGCRHACRYCYAAFLTARFSPHRESWGRFVDVKVNAEDLLAKALSRAKRGPVYLSSVTDCYQPLEESYGLTRRILKTLLEHQFPVGIQTKSPLVLRDLDLITGFEDIEVGMTVATDDERMRELFEPGAPALRARTSALARLREEGIKTYAFVGPMLPLNPGRLVEMLGDTVDSILVDRMNYPSRIAWFYRRHGLERHLEDAYFEDTARTIAELAGSRGITVEVLF